MGQTIGVLSLQGAVQPHLRAVTAVGARAVSVRLPDEIVDVDGLIIPGGESTTIGMLIERFGVRQAIERHAAAGKPIFGTCAGMILLAKEIADSDQPRLGLMGVRVVRNSFGRQVDSFESLIEIKALGASPFPGVFIRAPHIEHVEPDVDVLARLGDRIVLARQGHLLAASFHPELTDDRRLHSLFLDMLVV